MKAQGGVAMTTHAYKAIAPTIIFNGSFMDHEQTALQEALHVLVASLPQCQRCRQLRILVSVDGFTPFHRVFDFDFRCDCRVLFILRSLPLPIAHHKPAVLISGDSRPAPAPAARPLKDCFTVGSLMKLPVPAHS